MAVILIIGIIVFIIWIWNKNTKAQKELKAYLTNSTVEREAVERVKHERMTPEASKSDNVFVRLEAQRNAQNRGFAQRESEAKNTAQALERENPGAGTRYLIQRELELLPDSMFRLMCTEVNINPEPRSLAINKLINVLISTM